MLCGPQETSPSRLSIMELVEAAINRLVPELPEEQHTALVNYLKSEGYQYGKDLRYVEIDDLKPHVKLFYARKLLKEIKNSENEEPTSSTVRLARELPTLVTSTLETTDAATTGSRRWLQDFEIKWLDFPKELLIDCKEGRRPEPRMRRNLVKALGVAIATYDSAPGMTVVKQIAQMVVTKYPKSFSDMTSAGDMIGDGAASLARQLAVFLENRRRPRRNEKRRVDSSKRVDEPQVKKIRAPTNSCGCVAWQPDCECWEILEEKRCLLLQSSLSHEEIGKLMAETYPLQRKEFNEGKVRTENVRELWPHLLQETFFFGHLDTLVGFPFREVFIRELTLKGPKVVDHMMKLPKNAMRTLLQKVTSAVNKDGEAVPRYYYILELLCFFFNEDYNQMVSFHPHASEGSLKGLPSTPHLAVIGSSLADINKIVLVMDQEEYISTTSFEKALGLLLGAFFVWNIAYPSGCPLTLEFLQRYIGQINPTKGRGKGKGSGIPQRVLSLLKAL
ncbi:uncharacterized protein LOC119178669 isoform X7 [Rhipicephalus microplus]|uniref:uncharacterized protein LOC119178669 isoform X7 n=1 Tax=Rhipicephalus microplus TaxID=6941 RepID=UPI003F6B4794